MKQLKRRVLSVLVLAAILVPMIALVAFAGSPKQSFNFTWNGATGSKFSRGYKTDVGDSSGYYAQANITGGEFGGSTVSMWVERPDGTDVTTMGLLPWALGTSTTLMMSLKRVKREKQSIWI